jgi:spermidine synthase
LVIQALLLYGGLEASVGAYALVFPWLFEGVQYLSYSIPHGAVALLTGFSMMSIQTAIIRIAGLSFGSSQFTFSMVVAVFVLCIALGSFAVSALSRIPTGLLIANQWLLALFFMFLYPKLDEAPHWVYLLRILFRDTDLAFWGYYLLGFAMLVVVIGVPVLLSGAALPLLFHRMRRDVDHLGDLAGNLYSWNTVGSLLGALLGGYALLFWLDLHQVFLVAVAALLAAAVFLTVRVYALPKTYVLVLVPILLATSMLPGWEPRYLHAGLFRKRIEIPGAREGIAAIESRFPMWFSNNIIFQTDDPISSVTVREWNHYGVRSVSIATHGKSDGDTLEDYMTMGLVAVVSAMFADAPKRASSSDGGRAFQPGSLRPSIRWRKST